MVRPSGAGGNAGGYSLRTPGYSIPVTIRAGNRGYWGKGADLSGTYIKFAGRENHVHIYPNNNL
jgi:hypothetical protein